MIKAIYDLDMTPRRSLPIIINVSQNDDLGRTLVFNLFSSTGTWTAPGSATATLEGGKPDGKFFSFNCTYSKGTVTAIIQQQMTAVAGKVVCKVKVKSGDKVIESAPIYMMVDAAGIPDGADMSKSDINDAVASATQKIVEQVAGSIPEDYTKLSESVDELKSNLDDTCKTAYSDETELKDISDLFTLKGFFNKSGIFISSTSCSATDFINAKVGDVFYLYAAQDKANSFSICLYDDDKIFVKGVDIGGNYVAKQYIYKVEENGYIRFSTMNNMNSLLFKEIHKPNNKVFDDLKNTIGTVDTFYEDQTQFILSNGFDDKFINNNGVVNNFSGGFISDFIEVDKGDKVKIDSYTLYKNPILIFYYSNKILYGAYNIADTGGQTVEKEIPPMVKYVRISSLNKSMGIKFYIQKKKSIVEMLNITYDIPNSHKQIAFEYTTAGYITKVGQVIAIADWITTDFIELNKYSWLKVVSSYGYNACCYVVFDDKKSVLTYLDNPKSQVLNRVKIDIPQMLEDYPTAKYIRFCGITESLKVYTLEQSASIGYVLEQAMNTGNYLYGKKIAFCGDSFTQAVNLGSNYYDDFYGCYKSYGWRIANRNRMELYHDGIGGSTMHVVDTKNPNTSQPFAYQRYKNVPNDCDYIILQFGLNESSIANSDSTKGTKDSTDVTTMWGSWNTVLKYLIENHPIARIGVIMPDAWMQQSYFTTLKEICEWWGIPLLDLGGDPNVPVMNSGRRNNSGLTLNPVVAKLRNETFYNDPVSNDAHPNDAGHEWRSTVIENWIRSL